MRKPSLIASACLAVALGWTAGASAEVRTLLQSELPGPVVLVVNDPAANDLTGKLAIGQVGAWTLIKGKVLVAEKADLPAAVESVRPDAVVMLSVRRNAKDGPFQTVSAHGTDAGKLAANLNVLKDENAVEFEVAPADGALVKGAAESIRVLINIRDKAITPGARTRMFRHAVHELLQAKGMTETSPFVLVPKEEKRVRVAMYVGNGSQSTTGVWQYPKSMDTDGGNIAYTYVGPTELNQPEVLKQFDVVVFPGGMSNTQGKALGESGAKAVREFVKGGGGYVASCAGSYLATSGYSWSLKMIDADVIDVKHWLRGTGEVDIELTDEGRKIFGKKLPSMFAVHYANGPLLAKASTRPSDVASDFKTLAYFRSDMAKSAPGGVMPGTPAIIAGEYGEGRVLCFSPHPEYGDKHPEYEGELRQMITRAVRWAGKRPVAEE